MKLEIGTTPSGAELTSIKYNDREYLHQGDKVLDKDGKIYWKRRAPILFPIVGSLKNNTTIINGKKYEMSQHGFARDMKFDIVKISEREHTYVLKYSEETLKMYPYKFELYVTYLVDDNKLTIKYKVKNLDDKTMFFGLGGHPAFVIDLKNNKYRLEFEKLEENIRFYQLENGLISYKNNYINESILSGGKCINIQKDTFTHDAIIMSNLDSKKIRLIENEKVRLELCFSSFKYLAIWAKKGAPFVCIEPWLTTADYVDSNHIFEDKKDNIRLEPQNEFECEYSIIFE